MKVCVLDMQPISPPVGGGRQRLLGLYHALGSPTVYVGTYDWPGEAARDQWLSPTLREVTVPLSAEHFAAAEEWRARAGGKVIIDSAFHRLAHLSPAFAERVAAEAQAADVISMSHPWVYPLVAGVLDRSRQTLVYDAQNCEGFLRMSMLDDGGFGTEIAFEVIRLELELCRAADWILACSQDDLLLFHELYGIPCDKIKLCPNGVFTEGFEPPSEAERAREKEQLGIIHPAAAIFLGSGYQFNTEAAQFIIEELAPGLPSVQFVIAGGVGDGLPERCRRLAQDNVRITGVLPDEEKRSYLRACDVALNPMFGGSGTNIKMFDYMAAGLAVVSTPVGARGIVDLYPPSFLAVPPENFARTIKLLLHQPSVRAEVARNARRLVCELYSWERISRNLGEFFRSCSQAGARPRLSVVALHRRRECPESWLRALDAEAKGGVEVVLVDCGSGPWRGRSGWESGGRRYLHAGPVGMAAAANAGSFLARGEILLFLEVGREVAPGWNEEIEALFQREDVIARLARGGLHKLDIHGLAVRQTALNHAGGFLRGPDPASLRIAADWVELERSNGSVLYGRSAKRPDRAYAPNVSDWIASSPRDFVSRAAECLLGRSAPAAMIDGLTGKLERGEADKTGVLVELEAAARRAGSAREIVPLMPDVFTDDKVFVFYLADLLKFDGREFVENLYRTILRREPDECAYTVDMDALVGESPEKEQLIRKMLGSEEAGRVGVKVIGIDVKWPADALPGAIVSRSPAAGQATAPCSSGT